MDFKLSKTNDKLNPELFNSIALDAAKQVARAGDRVNKATQLRKFYDELVMWDQKTNLKPESFDEYLPFIKMLNAKVAYAEGRKLVDPTFVGLLNHGLKQVDSAETLHTFKLFMEAFMGFYKQERPN
ncbi:type III-A CRISPR-associated protein Csm2 [Methylomonas sp. HYX-M1]|uniref:type III-A CRISPR-associated protein Csm2 n=1 Tax=Methylomonas sp. HYX-M1 TaxID=3139307 RepID=UPI00345C5C43